MLLDRRRLDPLLFVIAAAAAAEAIAVSGAGSFSSRRFIMD